MIKALSRMLLDALKNQVLHFSGKNVAWGKNYKHLSLEEQTMIQTRLSMGFKLGQIAQEPGRSASILSGELKRNGWVRPQQPRCPARLRLAGGYRSEAAHTLACASKAKPHVERRLRPGAALWDQVMRYLKAGYSPELIAGTLAAVHPDLPALQVFHEASGAPRSFSRQKLSISGSILLHFLHLGLETAGHPVYSRCESVNPE